MGGKWGNGAKWGDEGAPVSFPEYSGHRANQSKLPVRPSKSWQNQSAGSNQRQVSLVPPAASNAKGTQSCTVFPGQVDERKRRKGKASHHVPPQNYPNRASSERYKTEPPKTIKSPKGVTYKTYTSVAQLYVSDSDD